MKKLEELCMIFRRVIERQKQNTKLFKDFPNGCCRDTSILLGLYLAEQGYEGIRYCNKDYDDLPSHAWLEYGDLIIDLTADQFGNEFAKVTIKANKSRHNIHVAVREQNCNLGIAGWDAIDLHADFNVIKIDIKS